VLTIQTFPNNPLEENTYVVSDETGEAVIIDCGAFYRQEKQQISDYIKSHKLHVVRLLQTHAHFDHIFGAQWVSDTYQVFPEVHSADIDLYLKGSDQLKEMYGTHLQFPIPKAGPQFSDNAILTFGNHQFKVLHTPGHTPGGCCFYCETENVIFTGDSLFRGSIGRTDFPGGNTHNLIEALLNKVLTLPEATAIYPGHGPSSSVSYEQNNNPYL